MQTPILRKDSPRQWPGRWPILGAVLLLAALGIFFLRSRGAAPPKEPPAPAEKATRSGYHNRALFHAPGQKPAAEAVTPVIVGTVYDMEGALLGGAKVVATTFQIAGNVPTTAGMGTSDERGHFELRLPEGSYHLTGDKDGYGPTLVIAHSGDTVSLVLPRSGVVEGHVYDEQNRPVTRFAIDVITAAPDETAAPAPLWSKRFDSPDGSYRVSRLPAWPVSIRVTAPDYAPSFSSMLKVEAGKVKTVDLTLSSGCTVLGRVEDAAGQAVPYAYLDAESRMGAGMASEVSMEAAKQTQSETDGRFRLDHVPTGQVLVRAYDGSHAATTVSLQINDCAKIDPLKVVMTAGGGVAGTVRGDDGKAVAGARLTLSHRSVGFVDTVSDAEGRYRFEQIPANIVRLEAQSAGRRTAVIATVKEGETLDRDIVLPGKGEGEIHGRITASGNPLAGMQVLLASNHGEQEGVALYFPLTGPDGTFKLGGLPEGGYLVSVSSTVKSIGVQLKAGETVTTDLDVTPTPPAPPAPTAAQKVEERQVEPPANVPAPD